MSTPRLGKFKELSIPTELDERVGSPVRELSDREGLAKSNMPLATQALPPARFQELVLNESPTKRLGVANNIRRHPPPRRVDIKAT